MSADLLYPDVEFTVDDLVRSLTRESFAEFVKEFWDEIPGVTPLIWNWHLDVLCEELQRVAERVFRGEDSPHDLIVNVPPGTSKSSICSILFPCWVWTRMHRARFITASHADDLVIDLSTKARNVLESDKYRACFQEIELTDDQNTKHHYRNTLGGERKTCTVGGKSPVGFHAHFILVDDPIDPQASVSEAELANAHTFMTATISGRKVSKTLTPTVLIMQRLHERDPTQVMLNEARKEDGTPVRHVCLPGELTDDTTPEFRGYYTDGLLDSHRLPRAVLKRELVKNGPYWYAAQYLQKPTPLGGGMFKDFYFNKRVKAAPYDCTRIRYWDRACLVGDTLVETIDGPVPIKDVNAGDLVLTRKGYRRVKWSGITKWVDSLTEVRLGNGSLLTGTGDHKVWTENLGWLPLSSIVSNCYNQYVTMEGLKWLRGETRILSQSYLTGSTIRGRKEGVTSLLGGGTGNGRSSGTTPCTGLCGGFTTGRSLMDTMYIMRMATLPTTTLATLNASLGENTTGDTIRSRNGTADRRLKSREERTERRCGNVQSTDNTLALSVELSSPLVGSTLPLSIALHCAVRGIGSGRSLASAFGASTSLKARRERITAHDVDPRWVYRLVPVYDLEVGGEHEFFANGILVHNSTSDGGCYTAGVLMAKDRQGNYYVEHAVHGQWEPVERNKVMKATAYRDRARYEPDHAPTIYAEMEPGSSGVESWQNLARDLDGFPVKQDRPTGNKDTRAEPWSTQCAAGNVYLVDDGTWDVQAYVDEHMRFKPEPGAGIKRGRYKDQVDASSGAYNLLTGKASLREAPPVRVYNFGRQRKGLRVLVTSLEDLPCVVVEAHPALLVSLDDPEPLGSPEIPQHSLARILGSLKLRFSPLDPADHQEAWEEPLAPYGLTPGQVMMSREHGRELWRFLLRRWDPPAEVVVIQDGGDGRALSVAKAVCAVLRLQESQALHLQTAYRADGGQPPHRHVYEVVKAARSLVVA